MLAPSNVWLNFSSCIVSGASGVKVPPAIKGSPFFRYCGSRIVDGRSRRNVKRSVAKNAHTCCPGFLARIIIKDRARRSRYNASFPRVQRSTKSVKVLSRTITLLRDYYILTAGGSKLRDRDLERLRRSSKIFRSGAKILD